MTLQDFFHLLAENPTWLLAFFILVPLTAFLAGVLGKGEGHQSPWTYLYSTLIYMACIPGVFAVTLTVYLFLFERRSILETNMYTQIFPILSMVATLWVIRQNVSLDRIPGFEKITGFIFMTMGLFAILWILDKTRIWVVSFLPFWQGMLIFAGLFLVVRMGWKRMANKEGKKQQSRQEPPTSDVNYFD